MRGDGVDEGRKDGWVCVRRREKGAPKDREGSPVVGGSSRKAKNTLRSSERGRRGLGDSFTHTQSVMSYYTNSLSSAVAIQLIE